MPGRAVAESPLSSQSSLLSGPSSDDELTSKMTKSKRGKRVIGDSDDADTGGGGITLGEQGSAESGGEEEEEENVAESGTQDNGDQEEEEEEEEEEEREGDGDDDDDEEEEVGEDEDEDEEIDELDEEDEEDGVGTRGSVIGRASRRATAQSSASKSLRARKTRSLPTRRSVKDSTTRSARSQRVTDDDIEDNEIDDEDELEESPSEEDGSEAQTTPNSTRSKRITLRLSSSAKGKSVSSAPGTRRKRGRTPSKATTKRRPGRPSKRANAGRFRVADDDDDEEEDEDELEEEQEGVEEDAIDREASSEDFENENAFASLPKTARQLAKERAAQGLGSPEDSDAQDAVDDVLGADDGAKKQQMTESELALKRSEMARRRRNQTEKKLEDDKIETINRLLKKQVSRRNTRAAADGDESDGDNDEDGDGKGLGVNGAEKGASRHHPTPLQRKQLPQPYYRYIQSIRGSSLSLPAEHSSSTPYKHKWDDLFHAKDDRTRAGTAVQ